MNIRTTIRNAFYNIRLILKLLNEVQESDMLREKEYQKTSRTDVINLCARLINSKNYLEIGVRNPEHNFNKIQVKRKTSVDPGLELQDNPVTHALTSDEFFKRWKNKAMEPFDLIFIDGLHLAEQVSRDIQNAITMSTAGGIIILHDCNPPNQYFARENYLAINPAKGSWNGTTFKAAWEYAFTGKHEMRIVDCDMGVGVIQKSKSKSPEKNPNPYFEWNKFEIIRRESGLLIHPTELETWLNSNSS
ncbi:MAG: class I SAM-dependent methyltransferase [Flavobacteriales bacterium]|nr:class I SAM-dependent methyltransferase [Flavobacteriales bacterium]